MSDDRKKRVVWLVVREDEPGRGEWFAREREASLKATWLRQSWKAKVRIVRATVDDDDSGPASPPSRKSTLRP